MQFPRPSSYLPPKSGGNSNVLNRFTYCENSAVIKFDLKDKSPVYSLAISDFIAEAQSNQWPVIEFNPIGLDSIKMYIITHRDISPDIVDQFNRALELKISHVKRELNCGVDLLEFLVPTQN